MFFSADSLTARNQQYLDTVVHYATAAVLSAELIRAFPHWLKSQGHFAWSLVWLTEIRDSILIKSAPVTRYRRVGTQLLESLIQARLDGKLDENGEKYDDLIQWLVDAAPPIERTIPQLAERIMALNVASIHTTTMVNLLVRHASHNFPH